MVPCFNGGLFTKAATLPLGDGQVQALTKASESNWSYVDPHIFGSVFQDIMDDAERHASGAHYTAPRLTALRRDYRSGRKVSARWRPLLGGAVDGVAVEEREQHPLLGELGGRHGEQVRR